MQSPAATSALETWNAPASGSSSVIGPRPPCVELRAVSRSRRAGRDEPAGRGRLGPTVKTAQAARSASAATTAAAASLSASIDGRLAGLQQRLEQPQLGREIVSSVGMVVEVVARQIGEGAGREAQPVEPVLVEAVRGGFDREVRDAVAGEPVEGLGAA